jgi:hypothetical protein
MALVGVVLADRCRLGLGSVSRPWVCDWIVMAAHGSFPAKASPDSSGNSRAHRHSLFHVSGFWRGQLAPCWAPFASGSPVSRFTAGLAFLAISVAFSDPVPSQAVGGILRGSIPVEPPGAVGATCGYFTQTWPPKRAVPKVPKGALAGPLPYLLALLALWHPGPASAKPARAQQTVSPQPTRSGAILAGWPWKYLLTARDRRAAKDGPACQFRRSLHMSASPVEVGLGNPGLARPHLLPRRWTKPLTR